MGSRGGTPRHREFASKAVISRNYLGHFFTIRILRPYLGLHEGESLGVEPGNLISLKLLGTWDDHQAQNLSAGVHGCIWLMVKGVV